MRTSETADEKTHGISIVIPAHNEAQVIERGLRALFDGAPAGSLDVVVVCNGCVDGTADVARRFGSHVRVIELSTASKSAALNAGDQVAAHFPRFYVDADVVVSGGDLHRVAAVLRDGDALAASPGLRVDTTSSSWGVRRYYRFWQTLPQIAEDLSGRGVYGTSEEGRQLFGLFPDVIADDLYFRSRFPRDRRRSVPGTHATVFAPRTLRGLVRRRVRVQAGNAQLTDAVDRSGGPGRAPSLLTALRRGSPVDAVVFVAVALTSRAARMWTRRVTHVNSWPADDSRPSASTA